MPYPSIKPLIAAAGLTIMFCGLMTTPAVIFIGAAILVGALYAWLCSPLEPEHH